MKAVTVWRQLTWAQRWTLLLALVWLPLFAIRVRRTSVAHLLSRTQVRAGVPPAAVADARAAARAVNLVAGRLRATCLTRSLVLHRILAGRGIATVLRVGVRNEGDGLQAHAWVECDGVPVNDTTQRVRGFARVELP